MNVTEYYARELTTRGYQSDTAQRAAIDRLQRCYDEWVAYKARRSNAFKKLIIHPDLPRGVYMWGGVGRGKSFLMDSFFAVVPVQRKTRLHFHEFMREVHRELEELKGQADPLDELARRIAKRYRLICFDEFHVSDIADAMILYRLLDRLFTNGVQFVMTSNYDPDDLYPDGLHRDRMLPAIALLRTSSTCSTSTRASTIGSARSRRCRCTTRRSARTPTAHCATPSRSLPRCPTRARSCTSRSAS